MSATDLNEKIRSFLNSALKKITAKDYDSAISNLKEAEKMDKENPEILYNLGICYCRKNDYKTAIDYFNKVRNLPFTFVDIITVIKMLSYASIMTNDLEQAKKSIEEGLEKSKDDSTLLNMLGFILEKQNKYYEAINIYKKILDVDYNNPNAFNSIAYIIAKTGGELNEALSYARNALKQNPDNPAYLDTIGYVQLKRGQTDIAKNYLKKALERSPESGEIKDHINQLLKITSADK